MTFRQHARALRRRAWLLVLLPLAAIVSGVAVTQQIPPVYESDVSVLVRTAQPISSLDPGTAAVSAEQVSRTYAQLMTQRPLLEKVVADLQLQIPPDQLEKSVKVVPLANTTVLTVTVQNANPRLAKDIANKLVEDFIAQTKQFQQSQIDQYSAKIAVQLDQLRKQIEKEQARVDQLQAQGSTPQSSRTSPQPSSNAARALKPEEQTELSNLQQQVTLDRSQYLQIVRNESDMELNVARATDSVIVVSPAALPTGPSSPKLWLNTLVAAFAGLVIAIGLIVLLEQLDQSIRNAEQLVERTGLVPLASIPAWSAGRRGKELALLHKDPSLADAYRTLRTNILFSTIDRQPRTIAITSAIPREGKSRTAANLAIALAAAGHPTVLIDCDFRHPAQHRLFGRVCNVGLADLILRQATDAEAVSPVTEVPNLWILCSGPTPPNPSELLGSARMRDLLLKLANEFAHVVIDTPPVNLVADALVVASYTDTTLVVVEYGRSRYPAVRNACEALQRVGARVLGGVLNNVPSREGYGYYGYNYSANGKSGRSTEGVDRTLAETISPQAPPAGILE
jgi:capsular exopolysaccharide synthesis family protein